MTNIPMLLITFVNEQVTNLVWRIENATGDARAELERIHDILYIYLEELWFARLEAEYPLKRHDGRDDLRADDWNSMWQTAQHGLDEEHAYMLAEEIKRLEEQDAIYGLDFDTEWELHRKRLELRELEEVL